MLIELLELRWHEIFQRLEAGDVVPPTLQLRAEGIMEAAVATGEASESALLDAMENAHRQVRGMSIANQLGKDWHQLYPFPQIPAVAQRAPVYPSTRD
ncbi:MAG: hypothetical protein ABJ084_05965 [Halioglobus sp.]